MAQIDTPKDSDSMSSELIFGSSVVGVPIVLTAVRCTLQYILLPVVLPLLSIQDSFSPTVNMAVTFFGLGVILYNLKRLWYTSWRTRYILLSLVIVPFILLSFYFDYLAYLEM